MKIYNETNIPEQIDGMDVIQETTIAYDSVRSGQTIARYEFGDSMFPILKSGQFCKIVPLTEKDEIKQGDCVFSNIDGCINTHMVWLISENEKGEKMYCIASTSGHIMGWTKDIAGKCYGIEHMVEHTLSGKKKVSSDRYSRIQACYGGSSTGWRLSGQQEAMSRRIDELRTSISALGQVQSASISPVQAFGSPLEMDDILEVEEPSVD